MSIMAPKEAASKEELEKAVLVGDYSALRKLLEQKANPDSRNESNSAVIPRLHYAAAEKGHSEIVKLLLEAKASQDPENYDGMNPLHCASKYGQPEVVKILLDAKANPNSRNTSNDNGEGEKKTTEERIFYPLHSAVTNNEPDLVGLLLESKANPNCLDNRGFTPLTLAYGINNTEIVGQLLRSKAELQKEVVLAHVMAENPNKRIELAQLLIQQKADVNATCCRLNPEYTEDYPFVKKNALQHAAMYGDVAGIRLLVENKASPDQTSDNPLTPLTLAAENARPEAVKVLLEYKARPQPCSVAHVLEWHGQPLNSRSGNHIIVGGRIVMYDRDAEPTLTQLLEAKAEPDSLTLTDRPISALHWAVGHNEDRLIEILLKHKANPNLRAGTSLDTPLQFALSRDLGQATWFPLLKKISEELVIEHRRQSHALLWLAIKRPNRVTAKAKLKSIAQSKICDVQVFRIIFSMGGVSETPSARSVVTTLLSGEGSAAPHPQPGPQAAAPHTLDNTQGRAPPPENSQACLTRGRIACGFFTLTSWGWGATFTSAAAGEKIKLLRSVCFAAQVCLGIGLLLAPIIIGLAIKYYKHQKTNTAVVTNNR